MDEDIVVVVDLETMTAETDGEGGCSAVCVTYEKGECDGKWSLLKECCKPCG